MHVCTSHTHTHTHKYTHARTHARTTGVVSQQPLEPLLQHRLRRDPGGGGGGTGLLRLAARLSQVCVLLYAPHARTAPHRNAQRTRTARAVIGGARLLSAPPSRPWAPAAYRAEPNTHGVAPSSTGRAHEQTHAHACCVCARAPAGATACACVHRVAPWPSPGSVHEQCSRRYLTPRAPASSSPSPPPPPLPHPRAA